MSDRADSRELKELAVQAYARKFKASAAADGALLTYLAAATGDQRVAEVLALRAHAAELADVEDE